jgi:two-component system sensor histidine kinase BarA
VNPADLEAPPVSIIDRPVLLAEVFEPDLFEDLCRTYVDLYRVGLKVFDASRNKIVDVPFGAGLGTYLFHFSEPKRRQTQLVSELKAVDLDVGDWRTKDDETTGTRYLLAPIVYEGDVLGKLVIGPYVAANSAEKHRPEQPWFEDVDAARFDRLRDDLRRVNDSTLRKIIESLLKAIDVVCHSGYKALLTSNMHLESITSSYDALQEKNRQLEAKNLQLEETNERLRELDKLKSNFLATVSHELRTPLTSVIGYSEMLLEGLAGPLREEQREYVGTIMEKGESLLHLISGILDISKIEKGVQEIVRQRVRPETLVESAVSTVRPQAQKKELLLDLQTSADTPDIHVDVYKVRQVLINLLGNAVKFTPVAGTITVATAAATLASTGQAGVRFEVRDTGIGIPADKLGRIFDVFFQVDNTSTREYGGTGLGLAIVKSFVESHGGEVAVTSELGAGSTFTFVLPADATPRGLSGPVPTPVPERT